MDDSPLIVDAHQDLAWNALSFQRDYTRPAAETRQRETGTETPRLNGSTLLGLPEYLAARVAVIFAALYATPRRRQVGARESLVYRNQAEAHTLYNRQLDYYHRLADHDPRFRLVGSARDLEAVLATWQAPRPADGPDPRVVGLVPLIEGADAIRAPEEVEQWMARGVRVVGLAWAGTRYAGGTGEPGPLTAEGRRLLGIMAGLGLMLDLAHCSDQSLIEAAERFDGVLMCTHANPRALLKRSRNPERHLSDTAIRLIAERDGVIGIMPCNRFLKSDWVISDGKAAVPLDLVAAAIDHVCQLTGSVAHVGLGTDFDGGFGAESTPDGIDTIADLPKLIPLLTARGYTHEQVAAMCAGNWLRVLRKGLP